MNLPDKIEPQLEELRDDVVQYLTRLANHYEKEHPDPDMRICAFLPETIDEVMSLFTHQLELAKIEAKIEEISSIAPDMRTHPKYKGYVETSASGKWQPLSKRLSELTNQKQELLK